MEELIFEIFTTIAEEAMNRGYDIRICRDTDAGKSKTIISESNHDRNCLEMNCFRSDRSNEYEEGYDQGCMDMLDQELGEEYEDDDQCDSTV